LNYLLVVLLLGFLILVHEAGHLAAARAAGIPVATFSIGFGPALWKRYLGETEYRVSLIPLGGYLLPALKDEDEYFRIPARKRILLALGGPAANLFLTPVLLALAGLFFSGLSPAGLFVTPFAETFTMLGQTFSAIPVLFSRPDQLSGVVGIVAQGGQIIGGDAAKALHLTAFLSVNLAVLNLLPLPALDGGRILLCILEKIDARLRKLHVPLSIAGWVLILGLMLYATVMDVGRLLA